MAKNPQQPTTPPERRPDRTYATNRQAHYDYHIVESLEAGIELEGTEVKSIREGNVNLRDAYARSDRGEIWLWNAHISPWAQGNRWNHEPRRQRRLLLHTRQIDHLAKESKQAGMTLVPLRLYDHHGKIKLEIGLGKGKKTFDKRATIADRESKREIDRVMKEVRAR